MRFEGRGGGTDSPWITVFAGPQGAHPMVFRVTQDVWDYVVEHGLDLEYNRRVMQGRLDAIKALLESPPVQSAVAAVKPAVSPRPRYTPTPLGWALGATVLAGAGAALAVRGRATTKRRPAPADRPCGSRSRLHEDDSAA